MEETSLLGKIMSNPFLLGLLLGLAVSLFVWIKSLFRIKAKDMEIKNLRGHLHTKLEIDSAENERRKNELERIKQERDNLRNMVQVLNQKPGRQEVRQFNLYQRAVEIMFEKAPGFAPAWQITLKEAEEEMAQAEKGIIPFFKRITGSSPSPVHHEPERNGKKPLQLQEPAA